MGFLYALLLMCGWMLYGGANYYMYACNVPLEEGKFVYIRLNVAYFYISSVFFIPLQAQ